MLCHSLSSSFNGAATLSLRKRERRSCGCASQACFNGAATLSLRKRVLTPSEACAAGQLQWGRNFIVAETRSLRLSHSRHRMLQWGRNFIVAETGLSSWIRRTWLPCFNGAATLSLRKPVNLVSAFTAAPMLQWGRNFIVAETCVAMSGVPAVRVLQWGRNFIVAETCRNASR